MSQLYYKISKWVSLPITRKQLHRMFEDRVPIQQIAKHIELNELYWHFLYSIYHTYTEHRGSGYISGHCVRLYSRWLTYIRVQILYYEDWTVKLPNLLIYPEYERWRIHKFLPSKLFATSSRYYGDLGIYTLISCAVY